MRLRTSILFTTGLRSPSLDYLTTTYPAAAAGALELTWKKAPKRTEAGRNTNALRERTTQAND